MIDGIRHVIAGVAPPGFDFPSPEVDLWLPLNTGPSYTTSADGTTTVSFERFQVLARLRGGRSVEEAQSEIQVLLGSAFDAVRVIPLADALRDQVRPLVLYGQAAGLCLLLLAMTSAAACILSRDLLRQAEFATHLALGAEPARVARAIRMDVLVLMLLAGGAALGLQFAAVPVVRALAGAVPDIRGLTPDWRAGVASIALAVVAGLAIARIVSRAVLKADPVRILQWRSAGQGLAGGERRLLKAALCVQIAIASGLTTTVLTFAWTAVGLLYQERGYVARGLLVEEVVLGADGLTRLRLGLSRVRDQLRGAVAITEGLPVDSTRSALSLGVSGPRIDEVYRREAPGFKLLAIEGGYFSAMRTRCLSGTSCTDDTSTWPPQTVVLSRTAARALGVTGKGIGQDVQLLGRTWQVGGIVEDVVVGTTATAIAPLVYVRIEDLDRIRPDRGGTRHVFLIVRSNQPAAEVERALQEHLDLVPGLRRGELQTMTARLLRSMGPLNAMSLLFSLLSGVSICIAVAGIWGMTSHLFARRSLELSIRIALGARLAALMRLALKDFAAPAMAGILLGVPLGLVLIRAAQAAVTPAVGPSIGPFTVTAAGALTIVLTVTLWSTALTARRGWRDLTTGS